MRFLSIVLLPLLFSSCRSDSLPAAGGPNTLVVATAANVQFAMADLEKAFEASTDYQIDAVVSSTGKLTAQIVQGAPYDLLIAANQKYPESLIERGDAQGPVRTYALGSLVLWTTRDLSIGLGMSLLDELPPGDKIAIANPENAPYGTESIRALRARGQYDRLQSQLIYGESIAQTNQYIISGAAAVGFTAKSVVLSPNMEEKGQWITVPDNLYEPIKQGVVATTYGMENHPEAVQAFLEFLFSAEAQTIFRNYGYTVPIGD